MGFPGKQKPSNNIHFGPKKLPHCVNPHYSSPLFTGGTELVPITVLVIPDQIIDHLEKCDPRSDHDHFVQKK